MMVLVNSFGGGAVRAVLAGGVIGLLGLALGAQEAKVAGDAPKEGAKPETALAAAAESQDGKTGERERIDFDRTLNFDLQPDQLARVKKFLPNAFRKLSTRKPLHMVALGDSIVEMFAYDGDDKNWIKQYAAQFAEELARQFFYTGGVRIIKPEKGKLDKEQPHRGVEITLRNLGRGGKLSIHAIQGLSTYGLEVKPDVVMISFGINDAMTGLDLGVYARTLKELVATVRAAGGDVMLLGPTLIVGDPPEAELAQTRAFCDTMREVAEESGAFFCDLGDLSDLVQVPQEVVEPGAVFQSVVDSYRRFFDHEGKVDWVHPRARLHEMLGRKIYRTLVDGPPAMTWDMAEGAAVMTGPDEFDLTVALTNRLKEPQRLTLLPLVAPSWKPMDTTPVMELKGGEKRLVKIHYARNDKAPVNLNPMPSHEAMLRLPLLVGGGGRVRIEDVRSDLKPVALLWKVETLFNQAGDFKPANLLVNTTGTDMEARWEAVWMEQKLSGTARLEPGEQEELPLAFKLPAQTKGIPFNQKTQISVLVTVGELSLRFDRKVDLTANFGLKQTVSLAPGEAKMSPAVPGLGERGEAVTLRADADKDALFLTFEIRGMDLRENPAGGASWNATINLDARSYGKRLTTGVTDSIRLSGGASDGPATVGAVPPWAFGVGYAAKFDEKHIKAVVSSGSEGTRRVTVTVPRSYLYLHEWALGNGNSQLGISAAFALWQPSADAAGGGEQKVFYLLFNRHRDDVEGCAALELTPEATARWTVAVY